MTPSTCSIVNAYQSAPGVVIRSFRDEQTSHLIQFDGHSVLIDCHATRLDRKLALEQLPPPELILHTHVQPEHCAEGDSFSDARIFVHRDLVELASDIEAYRRKTRTVWEDPAAWGVTFGQEPYGLAGCVTMRPPPTPLRISGTFLPGDQIGRAHV